MKGGTVEDFVEYLYTCQDTAFIYKGITYWYQGYMPMIIRSIWNCMHAILQMTMISGIMTARRLMKACRIF